LVGYQKGRGARRSQDLKTRAHVKGAKVLQASVEEGKSGLEEKEQGVFAVRQEEK